MYVSQVDGHDGDGGPEFDAGIMFADEPGGLTNHLMATVRGDGKRLSGIAVDEVPPEVVMRIADLYEQQLFWRTVNRRVAAVSRFWREWWMAIVFIALMLGVAVWG